jgi:hypothetical protein
LFCQYFIEKMQTYSGKRMCFEHVDPNALQE